MGYFGVLLGEEVCDFIRRSEAKKRLKEMRENGLEEEVWHFYGTKTTDYPNSKQNKSPKKYISDIIYEGKIRYFEDKIYLVDKKNALEFNVEEKEPTTTREKVKTFDRLKSEGLLCTFMKDVKGDVDKVEKNFNLDYNGWKKSEEFEYSSENKTKIKKPDKIVVHS